MLNPGGKTVINLPGVFHLDEYEGCIENGKLYCKVIGKLAPKATNNSTYIWNPSYTTTPSRIFPQHSFYYGFCIDPENGTSEEDWIFNHHRRHHETPYYKLDAIQYHSCKCENGQLGLYDMSFIVAVALYLIFIAWATVTDCKWRKHPTEKRSSILQKIVNAFSLQRNWEALTSSQKQFGETTCLQGVRVTTMLCVILLHTMLSYMINFFSSYADVMLEHLHNIRLVRHYFLHLDEQLNEHLLTRYVLKPSTLYTVQPFFVLSAFLLAKQTHELYERNGRILIKDVLLIFLNRYLRLITPVAFALLYMSGNMPRVGSCGPNFDVITEESDGCAKYWWATMCLVHNNLDTKCFMGLWYVSADTQLYAVSLLMLYLMYRFRNIAYKIYGCCVALALLWQIHTVYTHDLPSSIVLNDFRSIRLDAMFSSKVFLYLYFSTLSSATPYFVGIACGLIYSDKKMWLRLKQKLNHGTYWLAAGGICSMVLYITAHSFSGLPGAMLGSLLKPLYAQAVCFCFIGMLLNSTNPVRKIFESRLVQCVAKVTYCTYVFHFFFVFSRPIRTSSLIDISMGIVARGYLTDVVKAFTIGTIMYLILELPMQKLQKLYVPQVNRHKVSDTTPNGCLKKS